MKTPIALALATALLAAACASGPFSTKPDPLAAQRAMAQARAAHATTCEGIEQAHNAGILKGAGFNKAKAYCITADDALDLGDIARATADLARAKTVSGQ